MRRPLLLKSLFLLFLTLCSTTIRAYDFAVDGLCYNIIESTDSVMVTTSSGSSYSGAIVIPETVTNNGTTYKVKGVEDYAFEGSSITSVDLSNVSTIGKYSFKCCNNLDSLTIGSKITEIPEGAFYGNRDAHDVPNGPNHIKYLTIPSQITSIGDYAFHYPNSLVKLEFEENSQCTRIGAQAFANDVSDAGGASMTYGHVYYEELNIPESVKFIGDYCFYGDENLKKVTLHEGLDSIGTYAFAGVKAGGGYSDGDCLYTQIEEITIPSTVTYIGDYAFDVSPDLKTVTYNAAAVKNEESYPFGKSYPRITKLVIGPKVREIPVGMFYRVTDTTGNLEIEWNAERCEYLGADCLDKAGPVKLTIGESVEELYTTTDSDGNELEEPAGLFVSIDSPGTGLGLTSLTTMNFNATDCTVAGALDAIPFTITSSNYNDNKDSNKNILPAFPLETVNFGNEVKTIPAHLFNGSSSYEKTSSSSAGTYVNEFPYLTTITIPASVETIGDYAFNDCTALQTITFGTDGTSALKTIGDHAFANCHNESLTSISLPSSLETIGENAFDSCKYVTSLTIPASVKSMGGNAFANWSNLATLTYNATGCTSAGSESAPVFANCPKVSTLTIADDVTTLPDYVFAAASDESNHFTGFDKITISSNMENIGAKAFYGCSDLTTVTAEATTPATCGTGAFSSIHENSWLVIPEDAAENYSNNTHRAIKSTKTGWSDITHMREDKVTITMTNADGYVTRYSPYTFNTDENVTGYVITGVTGIDRSNADENGENDEGVTFVLTTSAVNSSGTNVPAGTPVLLKGETNNVNGEYINYTVNDDNPSPISSYLHGTVESGTTTTLGNGYNDADYYFYTLSLNSHSDPNSHGFYWAESGGAPFEAYPDKSWLALPKSAFAAVGEGKTISLVIGTPDTDDETEVEIEDEIESDIESDEQTTGISTIATMPDDAVIYNMSGQRVKAMTQSGIYIVNGKKVVKR